MTEAELATLVSELSAEPVSTLRSSWRRLLRDEPPHLGRDLVLRTLIWRLQAKAFGGHKRATERRLDDLGRALEAGGALPTTPAPIKPGDRLVREWRGRTYRVDVADAGFEYDGATYGSLSKIARLITGARWSGPRFFGLCEPRTTDARMDAGND